jgi:tRNA threonylcarbamoyladenosine biosynthesis protein TsaE
VTWQITSTSSEATEQLAENLGRKLRGGEVIELVSDVGGGKTTFVRGLARGLGSPDKVASPTFTISREYHAGDRTLYHFDFYRLNEAGLMADELAELLDDPKAIVVVEWADVVEDVLPPDRLAIRITATGEHERQLILTCPEKYHYLRENT